MRLLLAVTLLLAPSGCALGGGPVDELAADDRARLYYLLAEPTFDGASLLTTYETPVDATGDPGYDALHALLTNQAPEGKLDGFNFAVGENGEPVVDVESVTHEDGVVEVSLRGDTRDPYPALDLCCIPETEAVVQSLVLTVQAALDTDDPVRFDVRSMWFDDVRGLHEADPSVVVPPLAEGSGVTEVAVATYPPAEAHVQPLVQGRVGVEDGCVVLDGRPTIWPDGWTAWQTGQGVVLLDETGRLAVREGQRLHASGLVGSARLEGPCVARGDRVAGIFGDVTVGRR
ncbi:hypothetical protein GCM10009623_19200 [Nocardioides aestuarii]|uniref:GerMN domain-containing protein n=1 Tax=Nocardioides aestuarii TaxID=252231 RepID=A0ABW4TK66_9ACTN